MFFRNKRVNTDALNAASAVAFLAAIAVSVICAFGFVTLFLIPFLFHHIHFVWR
jgi:hypothetical protein